MASGILSLGGALGLVGLVLAVALIILWLTIRSVSSRDRAKGHQPYREVKVMAEVPSGQVLTLTGENRALEAEVAEAVGPSRS